MTPIGEAATLPEEEVPIIGALLSLVTAFFRGFPFLISPSKASIADLDESNSTSFAATG